MELITALICLVLCALVAKASLELLKHPVFDFIAIIIGFPVSVLALFLAIYNIFLYFGG